MSLADYRAAITAWNEAHDEDAGHRLSPREEVELVAWLDKVDVMGHA